MASLKLHQPASHEVVGTMKGIGLTGTFHEWQDGTKARRDERLGSRSESEVRIGDRTWAMDSSGAVRELTGIAARRQITQDFIDSDAFAHHPEDLKLLGAAVLPDGRSVYRVRVAPAGGETYVVALDANTWLIDQTSYIDHDAPQTVTYSQYQVVGGMLIAGTEVDSEGDARYDIASHVTNVSYGEPIDPKIFVVAAQNVVDVTVPVSVPITLQSGLVFANVTIAGRPYHFLIDSGSQGDVLDPQTAQALGLHPEGTIEISGAERTAGLGIVQTPDMFLGSVKLPMHEASVVSLGSVLSGAVHIDGVLGYPFLASAEVRIDPLRETMLVGKPGSLTVDGDRIAVDTDRELPEIEGKINGVLTRLLVDTGNTTELLLFKSFIDDHQGVANLGNARAVSNYGVGGSTDAVAVTIDQLQIGNVSMFNRYANVILASNGAFADKNDGGNVGFGTLKYFVLTFDLANREMYLQRGSNFDDGRYRSRTEDVRLFPPRT
ncbi:MAG TPA: retropepsin-like aspartic protease [Candidatus Baltobacteraceae bacterium]|nr:retropepsin-like aspartic protease [Candidatus Baltobacteraceae bacterium]